MKSTSDSYHISNLVRFVNLHKYWRLKKQLLADIEYPAYVIEKINLSELVEHYLFEIKALCARNLIHVQECGCLARD